MPSRIFWTTHTTPKKTSPTTNVTPRTMLVHMPAKKPRFAGLSFFARSGVVAPSAIRVVAPVLAVAAVAVSDAPIACSLVLAIGGLGLGLPGFEGLPSIKAHRAPSHDRFAGAYFLADSGVVESSVTLVLAPVLAVAATLSHGPDFCSVVCTVTGLGFDFGLTGFAGFPSIKAQKLPNMDRFTGTLFLGGGVPGSGPEPGAGST